MAAAEAKTQLPTDAAVQQLLSLQVKDKSGASVPFASLVQDNTHPRVVTIFIRHFFCGICEHYLRALAKDLSSSTLNGFSPPTKLVVIGCGDPALIESYAKRTTLDYEIYADYTRAAYDVLGFSRTLAGGASRPEYSETSVLATTLSSFLNNVGAGSKMLSGGKQNQNGGELIWREGKVEFCHRMMGTTDHLGVAELRRQLEGSG